MFDAWSQFRGPSSSSSARLRAELTLIHALAQVSDAHSDAARDAVFDYVDVLVREGLSPEATLIAFKRTVGRAPSLTRYDPLKRELVRASLVSECIERYYDGRSPTARAAENPAARH